MTPNQALALASQCGYALKVKKKPNYKQVKPDHLCLYDILGFQTMVFMSILFDIWYILYVPDEQAELWLFLSGMAWTCSFPTLRRTALATVISERWTLLTFSCKRPFCSLEYRSERQKDSREVEQWLHSLVVTPFTWREKSLWSCSSQVLPLWVSLCLM